MARFYTESYHQGYRPFVNQWNAFLATIRNDAPIDQLGRVQDYVNFFGYVREPRTSTGADYWKSPAEFFYASGDCEDFAIAKYWSLRKIGFRAEALRILVVYSRPDRTAHVVLRVRIADDFYLLDNRFDDVRRLAAIGDYAALYGINETQIYLFSDPDRLDRDVAYDRLVPPPSVGAPTSAGSPSPGR